MSHGWTNCVPEMSRIPPMSYLMDKIPILHYSPTNTVKMYDRCIDRKKMCCIPQTSLCLSLYRKSTVCSPNSAPDSPYSSSNPVGLGLGPLGTVQSQQKFFRHTPLANHRTCPSSRPPLRFATDSKSRPQKLLSSASCSRIRQRTWVCQRNFRNRLLAHISPNRRNSNHHGGTR